MQSTQSAYMAGGAARRAVSSYRRRMLRAEQMLHE